MQACGLWNERDPPPLDDEDIWYRLRFAGTGSDRLRLGGLATISEVWLNGHLVLRRTTCSWRTGSTWRRAPKTNCICVSAAFPVIWQASAGAHGGGHGWSRRPAFASSAPRSGTHAGLVSERARSGSVAADHAATDRHGTAGPDARSAPRDSGWRWRRHAARHTGPGRRTRRHGFASEGRPHACIRTRRERLQGSFGYRRRIAGGRTRMATLSFIRASLMIGDDEQTLAPIGFRTHDVGPR